MAREQEKLGRAVLTPWDVAIDSENLDGWEHQELYGLRERYDKDDPCILEQDFMTVEPVTSEDGRSVGLVIMVKGGDYYQTDRYQELFALWLSRADAQQLGMALLKQASDNYETAFDAVQLLSPPGAYSSPRKTEAAVSA